MANANARPTAKRTPEGKAHTLALRQVRAKKYGPVGNAGGIVSFNHSGRVRKMGEIR
jgi:hypothetical protein